MPYFYYHFQEKKFCQKISKLFFGNLIFLVFLKQMWKLASSFNQLLFQLFIWGIDQNSKTNTAGHSGYYSIESDSESL